MCPSTAELGYAVVTFYLGLNLLTHLGVDRGRANALFARLEELARLAGSLASGA